MPNEGARRPSASRLFNKWSEKRLTRPWIYQKVLCGKQVWRSSNHLPLNWPIPWLVWRMIIRRTKVSGLVVWFVLFSTANYASLSTCAVASSVSPWIQRASDMKAEVMVNHDLERKLQQHNDEMVRLIKDVKLKVSIKGQNLPRKCMGSR
jgi:hypothetical protein